jgi:uncharacterized protein YrrD
MVGPVTVVAIPICEAQMPLAVTTSSGYQVQSTEGAIGHVNDFIMDDKSWAIHHLIAETGHWFSHKDIVISPQDVDRISYEESKVFVKVTKEGISRAPECHVPPPLAQESR